MLSTETHNYFPDPSWLTLGQVAAPALNPIANALYPMEKMTKLHASMHIPGLTGSWMDGTGGFWHRINHGHHFFYDGVQVLKSPQYRYGEFLHHLGLDTFTTHGVPNPLLPTKPLFNFLVNLGVPRHMANELVTINLPKIFGGSIALLCTGPDVWACFADTIPHTWTATAWHIGLGLFTTTWGCFPPNPLILTAGTAEIGVGLMTGMRTLVDTLATFMKEIPLITDLDCTQYLQQASNSIYPVATDIAGTATVTFPTWATSVTLAALFGACAGYWSGQSYQSVTKSAGIAAAGSAVASAVSGALTGHFIAPFLGGAAGFLTGLLLRKLFLTNNKSNLVDTIDMQLGRDYFERPSMLDMPDAYFNNDGVIVPLMQLPSEPIGMLKADKLLLDTTVIKKQLLLQ